MSKKWIMTQDELVREQDSIEKSKKTIETHIEKIEINFDRLIDKWKDYYFKKQNKISNLEDFEIVLKKDIQRYLYLIKVDPSEWNPSISSKEKLDRLKEWSDELDVLWNCYENLLNDSKFVYWLETNSSLENQKESFTKRLFSRLSWK